MEDGTAGLKADLANHVRNCNRNRQSPYGLMSLSGEHLNLQRQLRYHHCNGDGRLLSLVDEQLVGLSAELKNPCEIVPAFMCSRESQTCAV
jgi:hypothetical protein